MFQISKDMNRVFNLKFGDILHIALKVLLALKVLYAFQETIPRK